MERSARRVVVIAVSITVVKTLGRHRWKQVSGYHHQGRAEDAFFRYKSIMGDGFRARPVSSRIGR